MYLLPLHSQGWCGHIRRITKGWKTWWLSRRSSWSPSLTKMYLQSSTGRLFSRKWWTYYVSIRHTPSTCRMADISMHLSYMNSWLMNHSRKVPVIWACWAVSQLYSQTYVSCTLYRSRIWRQNRLFNKLRSHKGRVKSRLVRCTCIFASLTWSLAPCTVLKETLNLVSAWLCALSILS